MDRFAPLTQSATLGREWLMQMGRAATNAGMSIQYCMDLPAWAMASLDFAAVTNARGSGDNFPRNEDGPDAGKGQPTTRWKLAYSSLFYQAPIECRN